MAAEPIAQDASAPVRARSSPAAEAAAEARARLKVISEHHHMDLAAREATARAKAVATFTSSLTEPSTFARAVAGASPTRSSGAASGVAGTEDADGRQKVLGHVRQIMFERDGYFIFRMVPLGARSRSDEVTVKGHGFDLAPGAEVVALGRRKIETSEKYGRQTIIDDSIVYEVIPTTRVGIQKLLENGYVKGIGPVSARALCEKFDRHLFDVAEYEPQKLYDSRLVSNAQVKALVNTIREKKEIPRLMSYLAEVGLGVQTSHKVLKELGPGAVDRIRKNPYELMRVPSIGFSKADEVARNQGATFDSDMRVAAGLEAVLHEVADKGSTYIHVPDLKRRMADMLSITSEDGSVRTVNLNRLDSIVEQELQNSPKFLVRNHLVDEYAPHLHPDLEPANEPAVERTVSLMSFAGAERRIARRIAAIATSGVTPESRGATPSGKHFERLKDEQQAAVRRSLSATVSVITGRPGCGKTTVTKSVVHAIQAAGMNVMLMGPTNRSAKQLSEATGQRAHTLHRALGCRSFDVFEYGPDKALECDVVIADEKSMVDTRMMDRLLSAMRPGMCFIMVGDTNQLASINAGQVFADVIKSGTVPVSYLTEIHRTGKGSSINPNAHRICDKQAPVQPGAGENQDFSLREVRSALSTATDEEKERATNGQIHALIEQFKSYMAEGLRPEDIQVLTPQRYKSRLGANELNTVLKAFLNPVPDDPRLSIRTRSYDPKIYSIGDRIMYTANDPERDIYNGDIGYIKSIDHDAKTFVVDFHDEDVEMEFSELQDIDHSRANTVHKTQGGEFPAVIFMVVNAHYHMLDRQLLYTGLTRGKQRACLLGDTHRLQSIVEKAGSEARKTMLDDELVRAFFELKQEHKPTPARRLGHRP